MRHTTIRYLAGLALALALAVTSAVAVAFSRDIVVIRTGGTGTGGTSYRFNVELAISVEERSKGLMFREDLAPNAGMLFLYNQDQAVAFWMKNTIVPLDMIFIAADGKITQIVKNAQPESENIIPSNSYVRGVLEVNAGITDRYDIQPGDRVEYSAFKTPAAANSKIPGQ